MFGGRLEAYFTVPSGVTMSATNATSGPTSVSITAGSYTITSFCAHVQARLIAVRSGGTWTVTVSTGSSGTGFVTINCTDGAWALSFTTAEAGTVLGIVGNLASSATPRTGTQNARGLWLPDCPAQVQLDPSMAPKVTDSRGTESPSGLITTYKGTSKYVHKQLRYTHVAQARVMRTRETTTYASLQSWIDDTQYNDGHTWFGVGSTFQIYWSESGAETLVGYELNSNTGPTYGWGFSPAISDISEHISRVDANGNWMWAVTFDRIASRG